MGLFSGCDANCFVANPCTEVLEFRLALASRGKRSRDACTFLDLTSSTFLLLPTTQHQIAAKAKQSTSSPKPLRLDEESVEIIPGCRLRNAQTVGTPALVATEGSGLPRSPPFTPQLSNSHCRIRDEQLHTADCDVNSPEKSHPRPTGGRLHDEDGHELNVALEPFSNDRLACYIELKPPLKQSHAPSHRLSLEDTRIHHCQRIPRATRRAF